MALSFPPWTAARTRLQSGLIVSFHLSPLATPSGTRTRIVAGNVALTHADTPTRPHRRHALSISIYGSLIYPDAGKLAGPSKDSSSNLTFHATYIP